MLLHVIGQLFRMRFLKCVNCFIILPEIVNLSFEFLHPLVETCLDVHDFSPQILYLFLVFFLNFGLFLGYAGLVVLELAG